MQWLDGWWCLSQAFNPSTRAEAGGSLIQQPGATEKPCLRKTKQNNKKTHQAQNLWFMELQTISPEKGIQKTLHAGVCAF